MGLKVLLVCHNYLPRHTAGTEIYTAQLGKHLKQRGHAVSVFTADKDIGSEHLSLRRREHAGLSVFEVINNLYYESFRDTWELPEVAQRFGQVLDEVNPDVVHFQHLMYLSIGCIAEVTKRWIPILFTLHDYWLQCARYGQRVHADTSICHTIDSQRCGECLVDFKFKQTELERRAGKAIAALRGTTGINLAPAAVRAGNLWRGRRAGGSGDRAAELANEVTERERAFREEVVPHVHRFLSPSRFLRDRFIEWGVPAERIDYLRTGIDLDHFATHERTVSGKLRIAFVGTFARHKGPHVLLEAWGLLSPEQRAKGDLQLYGPTHHNPDYVAQLKDQCEEVGAELCGAMTREQVAEKLYSIDLLVVPSVWYENSPLVILEAITARTPILVSDLGGMAELVQEGENGFHFKVGDARDLALHLGRALDRPESLAGLYESPEPIKRVDQDAAQIEEFYFEAVDAMRARMKRTQGGV